MSELLDALRKAIERSGISRYRLSKELDISQGQLSRLMNRKGGLSIESYEKLAKHLKLKIKIEQPKRNRKK